MNNIFRTIWSVATQSWQAVSEIVKTAGKKSTKSLRNGALASVVMGLALSGRAESQPPPAANQLPTGGSVAQGSATIDKNVTAQASSMTVNQTSQRAVVNWETFNVGSSSTLNFIQPNVNAVTLNRVNDSNPSQIFGHINSNGQVFITNAHGVYFSPSSSVDVGALVATTHSISDNNFMSGNYVFERNGATGKIINEGNIKAALGGYIALLAPEVQNAGVVIARAGIVAMAAGEMISLKIEGAGSLAGITTTPSAIATLIENKQVVQAPDGQIILSAVALNKLQAGIIKNSGALEANSLVSKGGKIFLEGDDITLASTSKIEAKGPVGGGTVLVGGDWQGGDTLRQATKVIMEAGATIDASATDKGDGGKVVLWSDVHNADSVTRVSGTIKAEAGPNSGDGGKIETSGNLLNVDDIHVSTQAHSGQQGEWLLDPYDITIGTIAAGTTWAAGTTTSGSDKTYTPSSTSTILASSITNALATSNVTVSTGAAGSSGADNGDITNNVLISWSSANTLTFVAARNVLGTGMIDMSTGGGTFIINQAGTSTYSGSIRGTGNFIKQGLGTLTLSGTTSNYSGTTTITNGTLKAGSTSALGSTSLVNLANSSDAVLDLNSKSLTVGNLSGGGTLGGNIILGTGTLTFGANSSANSEYAGAISGTGASVDIPAYNSSIVKASTSTGTQILSGANTFIGVTTINAGTLKLGSVNALGTAANTSADRTTISTGATLDLNGYSINEYLYLSGTLTNSSATAVTGASTLLTGASIIKADAGAINLGAMAGSSAVALGGSTGGSFSGTVGLDGRSQPTVTKNGAGTWSFNGALNYLVGNLSITEGSVKVGALNTNLFGSLLNAINISSGAKLEMASNNNVTTTSPIVGAGSLLKSGSGTFQLSGAASTYSGGTTVSSGVLRAGSPAGGGTSSFLGASTSAVTVMDGAALDVPGNTVNNPITLNGTGINNAGALINSSSGSTNATLSGLLTLGSDSSIMNNSTGGSSINLTNVNTITGSGYSLTLGGSKGGTITSIIGTGSGSIIKSGAGTWTLSGVNTYTGNVYVNEGYLIANNSSALGTPAGSTTVASGASLGIVSATDFAEPLNLSGYGYSDTIGALHTSTTAIINYTGTMTLSGTTRIGVAFNKTLNIKTTIDNGEYDVVKYSTGTLNLQGVPNFSGTGSLKTGYALVKATGSPSVYGTTPVVSYQLYTTGAATTLATGVPAITGTAVFTGVPSSTSSAGTYSLKYEKGLTSTYAFFPVTASTSWVVSKAGLTVTAYALDKTYDGLAYSGGNGVSYSGFVNSETSSVLGGSVSYVGTSQGAVNTGSYVITPSGLTSSNYTISYSSGVLTINKAPLTVTAAAASKTYDGLAYSGGNGVSYSGFVNSETSSVLGGSVSYSGTSQGAIDAGTYVITPSGLTSSNYDISFSNGALTVNKAPLTVTATAASKTYDGLAYSGGNGVSYSGFVNSETSSVLGGSVSYSGTSQGAIDAGTYVITPSGLTSSNYDISFSTGGLTVNKAPLTVTAAAASKTYDGLVYSGGNGVSYSGFVNGETSSVMSGSVSYSGTSQGAANAGSYVITPSGLTSNNYDISYDSAALTINKAPLTVAAVAASKTSNGKAYSGGNGVSYSGFVNSETSSVLGGSVSYSGTSQGAVSVGSYVITPSGLTSNNYDISYDSAPLTIKKSVTNSSGSTGSTGSDASKSTSNFSGMLNALTINNAQMMAVTNQISTTFTAISKTSLLTNSVGSITKFAEVDTLAANDFEVLRSANGGLMTNISTSKAPAINLENVKTRAVEDGARSITSAANTLLPETVSKAVTQIGMASNGPIDVISKPTNIAAQSQSGILAVTFVGGSGSGTKAASMSFEQKSDMISLENSSAPGVTVGAVPAEQITFSGKLTTFLVEAPNGKMLEYQGGLVNNHIVIVAASDEAKNVARLDTKLVLAAAVTSLGKKDYIVLAELDGVIIDLR